MSKTRKIDVEPAKDIESLGNKTEFKRTETTSNAQNHMDSVIFAYKYQSTIIPKMEDIKADTCCGTFKNFCQALFVDEKHFWIACPFMFTTCLCYTNATIASWVAFIFAAYSAISNDSIQTLGSFIASNKEVHWFFKWCFVAGIFLGTNLQSYLMFDGDITFQRLTSKGFDVVPTEFNYLQIAAPVILLVLTKIRIPVSTSFMLLSLYVTDAKGFIGVITKSLMGQGIGIGISAVVQGSTAYFINKQTHTQAHKAWKIAQWATTCFLWSIWLQQDMSNLAVVLPRKLPLGTFIGTTLIIMVSILYMLVVGGDAVQKVVEEKSKISDSREASLLNLVQGIILFIFKIVSKVPMSTTWVFVGLITGREVSMAIWKVGRTIPKAILMGVKDVVIITIGFVISLAVGIGGNSVIRDSIFGTNTTSV